MRLLTDQELLFVVGGMKTDGRLSDNVIDLRGTDLGEYVSANNMCWSHDASSSDMYPDSNNQTYPETIPNWGENDVSGMYCR